MRPGKEAVGRSIGGKYRLGEVLAVGGMGVVHAGVHRVTGRAVAIKRLRSEFVAQPDIVRRVSLEASLAVDASHPNVVEVLDAGADENGVPYLVLERLYGRPLEALLEQPLPLLATAQALMPVANAVAALHRIGIVHRDIKPSNIFLHRDAEGRVTPKLLDFGIAKALARSGATLTGGVLGTPAYMAPEQLLGHGVGAAADVWAIGVVLARCLTGRLPFEHPAAIDRTLRSVASSEQRLGVPPAMAALLVRALAFEPSERPPDMTAFRAALIQALAAVDASAPWPGPATIGYARGEFVLSSAIEVDVATMRPAVPGCPRARGIETRTLPGAARSLRAGSASPSARLRSLLMAAAITTTGAAALFASSGARRGGEAGLIAEPRTASATASAEAPGPTRGGAPEDAAPQASVSADQRRAVGAPASPARAAPIPRVQRAGVTPPADGRKPRKPTPGAADAPSARGSAPSRPDASSKIRIGANRAPIIE